MRLNVIIAGSRNMTQAELIPLAVERSGFQVNSVICGMARGADTLGRLWAEQQEIPVQHFPADWNRYGRAAGPIRNRQMAEVADALIVFIWDNSKGSENMLKQMQRAGKPCFVVREGVLP